MRKLFRNGAPLFMAVLSFVSCLSDKETVVSSECAIVSFAVTDIASKVATKNYNGHDTIITRTISGSSIYFNIDQVNGLIYNVDSLPYWTNIERVVPKFSGYGNMFAQLNLENKDSLYYYVTSGSDSVNFKNPVKFIAISTDGTSSKTYTVSIRKHAVSVDTLEWSEYDTNQYFQESERNMNSIYYSGKVFVFHRDAQTGANCVSVTVDGEAWDDADTVCVDYSSVLVFNDKLYALREDDRSICSSVNGIDWTVVSDKSVSRLLAADGLNIYALDDSGIIGTSDFQTWANYGTVGLENLPNSGISSFCSKSKSNPGMYYVNLIGNVGDKSPKVWFKVTSRDVALDQDWTYMEPEKTNLYPLPTVDNFSVARLGDTIYGIGRVEKKYEYLYKSDDNGISWHPMTEKYMLPSGINDSRCYSKVASLVAVNGELWIIKGPYIWRGVIR